MSVEELKQLQAKIIKKDTRCDIIGIITFLTITAIVYGYFKIKEYPMELVACTLGYSGFASLIITIIIKNKVNGKDIETFYKEYKKIVVLEYLKKTFEDITYEPEKGFSQNFIDDIGMLDTGTDYMSNDYISGKYKRISFRQADMQIYKKQKTRNTYGKMDDRTETAFLGRLMIFDFNKKFKTDVQVTSKYFNVNTHPKNKKFVKVEMEDASFNNTFNVYAENKHEAFYILTPHLMEKMKELMKKLKCNIMFCFVDNELHIAVDNNDDSFEPNFYKHINEKEIEENITKDIKLITDFVDELNLDNGLFKS